MHHISKNTVRDWLESLRNARSQVNAMIAEVEKAIRSHDTFDPVDLEINYYLETQTQNPEEANYASKN